MPPHKPRARHYHGCRASSQVIDPRSELLRAVAVRLRVEAGRARGGNSRIGQIELRDADAVATDNKPIEAAPREEVESIGRHRAAIECRRSGGSQLQMWTEAGASQREARRGVDRMASLAGGHRHGHCHGHVTVAVRGPLELRGRCWRVIEQLELRAPCDLVGMRRINVALPVAVHPFDGDDDGAVLKLRGVTTANGLGEEGSEVGRLICVKAEVIALHVPLDC